MSSRIISGNRNAEDVIRAYYERLNSNPTASQPATPAVIPQTPLVQPTGSIVNGVYVFDNHQLVQATTPVYRKFLKESGYADLDSCLKLEVSKGVLRYDQNVRDNAARVGLGLNGTDGDYVVSINQINGRKLVEGLGGKLLPTQLMYNLFIPYIKSEASKGNAEAQATLKEMIDTKAEWLEDLIVNESSGILRQKTRKIKICNNSVPITLVEDKDGIFDMSDMNGFGYPINVKDTGGEFRYWHPNGDERAAIRNRSSELGLGLYGEPSGAYPVLGVRVAKFFL